MRKLRQSELHLITSLLKDNPKAGHFIHDLPSMFVEEMKDGGMGSLRFVSAKEKRLFGEILPKLLCRI